MKMHRREITISVVVPLFNKAPYIQRALQSVLMQNDNVDEILVVDDGSSDGGGNLVLKKFPLVRVIRQDNLGPGEARNTGFEHACSEWIAFLDADDFWDPFHVSELRRIIKAVPEASLVSTQHIQFLNGKTNTKRKLTPGKIKKIDFFSESSRKMGIVCSSSVAVRKEVYREIGGFGNTRTGEDTEYWARVALFYNVAISDAQTAFYVRGIGGVMETPAVARQSTCGFLTNSLSVESRSIITSHPACKTIVFFLDNPGIIPSRQSLLLYLNAWLLVYIRISIVQGDVRMARSIVRQIKKPILMKWYLIFIISFFPAFLLKYILLGRRYFRKFIHFIFE